MTVGLTIAQERSLLRPLQRTFYPTKIPHNHHQLKNFISTADPDLIYYASGHDIYALHLPTRKRESIASLPWKPQCLDARHGWICVGGPDHGRCAFICRGGRGATDPRGRSFQHEADVDALLPLDLDPDSRLLAHSYFQRLRASPPPRRSKPEVQIHELGGSIMNSVTIHRLPSTQKGIDDEIVCVMANNDCTIRIYSLSRSRLLDTLPFSTCMNHASLSPDGQILVAVGDKPVAFFCKRITTSDASSSGEDGADGHTWQQIAEVILSPSTLSDACFTTAFSPSGHVCAVAQQSGIVTLFDTSMIHEDMENDDAVFEVLKSSRPSVNGDTYGAVRSMSFSPPPWDLLAWAEDRGRICVTDLRTCCRSRQTVDLELDSPRLNRASLTDVEEGQTTSEQRELEIERRFLQRHREAVNAQNELADASQVANYIEFSAARRRLQRDTVPLPGDRNHLTETERQVLESLRTDNAQDSLDAGLEYDSQRAFSVNYPHDQNSEPPEAHVHTRLRPSSNGERASAQLARLTRMRDAVRGDHSDRSRPSDRGTYQPRRRSSMVVSSSHNPSEQAFSSHPSSLAPIGSAVPTLSASPSRLASVVAATAENADDQEPTPDFESIDAWRTVTDVMGSNPLNTSAETEAEALNQLRRQRRDDNRDSGSTATMLRLLQQQQQSVARIERLRNQHSRGSRQLQALNRAMAGENGYETAEVHTLRRLADMSTRREYGVMTMGIGWHADGRNL
ncbi:MAG: hypothetical protein L6R35_003747 [Caloplaca aegaea]|nr:MAG: hypothetical protein L6R35_003747 [Caloplaca aegaea]